MPFYYPDSIRAREAQTPIWKLMYAIESANGASVRKYQTIRPYRGRMFRYRIREDVAGSYGSCSVIR